MTLYAKDFSEAFTALLKKTGISRYKISQYTHLDQAYLHRLTTGEKQNPSLETIIKISLAFAYYSNQVQIYDIQRLFKSVGRSILTSED